MSPLSPEISAKIGILQALDDAIAYRSDLLDVACRNCSLSPSRCTDHSWDLRLLEDYQERYLETFYDAVNDMDPADIARIGQPGNGRPPPSDMLALAIVAHLRRIAADGPVMTRLDGRPVVIELHGRNVTERPLTAKRRQ